MLLCWANQKECVSLQHHHLFGWFWISLALVLLLLAEANRLNSVAVGLLLGEGDEAVTTDNNPVMKLWNKVCHLMPSSNTNKNEIQNVEIKRNSNLNTENTYE